MRRPTKMGETGMFSGLAYCADCGAKLYHCRAAVWTHEQECYTCANYRIRKQCSAHYIRAAVLKRMVLQNLQRVVACVHEDEDGLAWRVMESKTAVQRVDYGQAERGTVCEAVRGLRAGTDGLETVRCSLRTIVNAAEIQAINVQRFLKIVKKYTEPTKLTPAILREFAEKMVVHAPENPADTGDSGLLCITR